MSIANIQGRLKNIINNAHTPAEINFNILDGLRGIAATYVVFNHSRGHLFIGGAKYSLIKAPSTWSFWEKLYFTLVQATSLGKEFVILFFIISGFSIAYSFNKKPAIWNFYLRRIIRIYPPYVFALLWAYIVFQIMKVYTPSALQESDYSVFANWAVGLKNFFYIDNGSLIIQFWSLKYEVLFYLFIPIFMLNKNIYLIVSLIIAVASAIANFNDPSAESILGRYVFDFNIYFAVGVFCFHYYQIIKSKIIFNNKKYFFVAAIILFLLMIAVRVFSNDGRTKLSLIISAFFSMLLLFNFLHHNIQSKLLGFLGKISYSTYISHFASLMLLLVILIKSGIVDSPAITNKWIWLSGIPFALGLSYIFYNLVEKQTKKILEKLRSSKSKSSH